MGSLPNRQFWKAKATELGWEKPEWVHDLGEGSLAAREIAHLAKRNLGLALKVVGRARLSIHAAKFALKSMHIIRALSEYDFLLVYGLGPIYSYFADVPFGAIPFGGDVTIVPFEKNLTSRLQRKAYAKARVILTADPVFVVHLDKLKLSQVCTYFPFPVDTEKYSPSSDSSAKDEVESFLPEFARGKFIYFMPSRQDFVWKGTDKALRAFLRLSRTRSDIVLVTPSWGVDTGAAHEIVKSANVSNGVVFLPYALSKLRLITFLRAADVVLDQFTLGSYGTSMLEAMACEKAVITHVDVARYRPYLDCLPPNLQAETEEEILSQMKWAVENKDACTSVAKKSREWVINQHSKRSMSIVTQLLHEQEHRLDLRNPRLGSSGHHVF